MQRINADTLVRIAVTHKISSALCFCIGHEHYLFIPDLKIALLVLSQN